MALQGIEVEGIIIREYPAKEGVSKSTGNPWKSQEFVIQTKDQYPRACLFRVFGADRIAQFNIHQGDAVHVWLDINARQWQDRYFNDINCYQVDHIDQNAVGAAPQTSQPASQLGSAPTAAPQAAPVNNASANSDPLSTGDDNTDDLPF